MRRAIVVAALLLAPAQAQTGELDWLALRWNNFAKACNAWAEKYSKGQFDLQGAKRLSKLWREVESSGAWPKEKR